MEYFSTVVSQDRNIYLLLSYILIHEFTWTYYLYPLLICFQVLGIFFVKNCDVDVHEIEYISEKILHPTNSDALLSAWSDLEKFTRSKRVWKHKIVWDVLDKEVFAFDKSDHINDAIFIVKGMCFTSKRDNTDEVIIRVRQSYMQVLEHIMGSEEEKLINSKPDVKQILESISTEEERFYLFWRAWKIRAKIKNNHKYSRSLTAFIGDLEKADPKYKYSINRELYDFIEKSAEPIIRKRAKELKSLLFS